MDPYEGDFNDPMSLNRYAYVRGNPVTLTDPSGLCAESDPNLTQCHPDANYLIIFGFYSLWDESPLERIPEEPCLQAEVALAIQSNQKLKWTADEMRSLRNAVNVLYRANQNIDGFKEKYRFLVTPISIVKRDMLTPVPSPTPPPNAAPVPIEEYSGGIIKMLAWHPSQHLLAIANSDGYVTILGVEQGQ